MKRIAIIAPCILPVPATKGGAVEELITRLIDDNELNNCFSIDLYTLDDNDIDRAYTHTRIIPVKETIVNRIINRFSDKFYRTIHIKSSKRLLDQAILNEFVKYTNESNEVYEAVIIQNQMSTALEIVKYCNGRFDFPVYFHMHNDVDIYRSPLQIRELVRYGVQFISVSEYIKEQILRYDENAVITTLYNGVDLLRFSRINKIQNENNTTLLYAGRIIPGKGVKELVVSFIEMLNRLDDDKRNTIRLLIYGFSDFDRRYEREIKSLARGYKNIECLDRVGTEEMSQIYESADVVVMPTVDEEPFGLVALETMAKGIPLITTDSGALPEVVGDSAYIVDRSDKFVNKLSDAMMTIAFDKAYQDKLSQMEYQRAHSKKEFDIKNFYLNFMDIIDEEKTDSEDLISVIVPVYNISDYVRRCVSSITTQTYNNLEIIVVDDGSTDDSGTICDGLAQEDDRIKVIHKENAGLSSARNTGLDNAKGRYVFFCDSDDYLRDSALEHMLHKMKKDHADIVACGIAKVYDSIEAEYEKIEMFTGNKYGRWSGHESVIQMMRSDNVCTTACNKLYKSELFEGIRFPLGIKNEDEATTYKLLYRARIVSFIPDAYYMYYQRHDSIMHEDIEGRYLDFLEASRQRIVYFHDRAETELEEHSIITLLEWIKYSYRNIGDKEIKKELRKIYKEYISLYNAPSVMGIKKKMALLLWKYLQY